MTSKPQSQRSVQKFAAPASPRSNRTLRRYQSQQSLTSSVSSFSTEARQPPPSNSSDSHSLTEELLQYVHSESPNRPRMRGRSSSDVGAPNAPAAPIQKRPSRKTGSGVGVKKSGIEILLRDGPPNGNLLEGLQELRYLILSTRVDADNDGMSPYRIYLWLTLLNIPPLPTDEYLSLVHRGRSPAYAKIRNDTFRTLATDPLFKRRVTEASLSRLLNAIAWKLHDTKNGGTGSRSPSRKRERTIEPPPSIAEEPLREALETGTTTTTASACETAIYVQGMNVLCAPFLYAARSEVEAFALFHYFITKECPGYIRGAMDGVHKGLKLVDMCLEIVEPKLAKYLFSKGMHAELYAFPSVLTLCACTPPLPEVLHLWDFLFAYGPHLNILCIVAQLIRMRDTILKSPSPNKILRSFPPLDAKEIIALTVLIVRKIPETLYAQLVDHAK
ncbi:hypothetical protein VTN02DRAFT_4137 [Thermoascus thermophilus]